MNSKFRKFFAMMMTLVMLFSFQTNVVSASEILNDPAAQQEVIAADPPADEPANPPADEPADTPADEPADTSADEPADTPADELADTPADEPADTSADEPADTPADEPTDTPADEPTDTPADEPADTPADEPADTPADEPTDTPADEPADPPADEPTDTPTDEPADPPVDEPTDTPADEPTDTPADEPADTPADEPADTPADEPADTPADEPADTPADEPADTSADEPAEDLQEVPAVSEDQQQMTFALATEPTLYDVEFTFQLADTTPVANMSFTIDDNAYTTDASGKCTVQLASGEHTVAMNAEADGYSYTASKTITVTEDAAGHIMTVTRAEIVANYEVILTVQYNREAMSDVAVSITDSLGNVKTSGTTNSSGKVTFSLPEGEYLIVIEHEANNYTYYTENATISVSENTSKTVRLSRKNSAAARYDRMLENGSTFNHVDIRVAGTVRNSGYNEVMEKYDIVVVPPVKVTLSNNGNNNQSWTFNSTTSYEWRNTRVNVRPTATITLECSFKIKGTDDSTAKPFKRVYSGRADFIRAIDICDAREGLDFEIDPQEIVDLFDVNVAYQWEVEGSDESLNAAMLAELTAMPVLPPRSITIAANTYYNIDTTWTSGVHQAVVVNGDYYLLTFGGWTHYWDENTEKTALNGTTRLLIDSNTDIYGTWTYRELENTHSKINLVKNIVIDGSNSSQIELNGRWFDISAEDGNLLDVDFSSMNAAYDQETNTYTLYKQIMTYQDGEFRIEEKGVDIPGYTLATSSSVTQAATFSAEGGKLYGGSLTGSGNGAVVTGSIVLPHGDNVEDVVLGTIEFTNIYTKKIGDPVHKYPHLLLYKEDVKDSSLLAGATFRLTDPNGKAVTASTGEDGRVRFDFSMAGRYTLKEIAAPEGYVLSDSEYILNVVQNEKSSEELIGDSFHTVYTYAVELIAPEGEEPTFTHSTSAIEHYAITLTNDKVAITGQLQLSKTFADGSALTGDNFPNGIDFTVTGPNGYSKTVNLNAGNGWTATLDGLELGEYAVTENAEQTGYALESVYTPNQTVTISEGNLITDYDPNAPVARVSMEVANKYTKVYTDDDITTVELFILKLTEDGAPLKGAEFTLYNEDGSVTSSGTSDYTGKVNSGGLTEGTYYLKESSAPVGYIASDEVYTIVVKKTEKEVLLDSGMWQKQIKYYVESFTDAAGNPVTSGLSADDRLKVYNELITVDIPVEKIWKDNGNQDGKRPESVTINLTATAGGETAVELAQSAVLSETNAWKSVFADLPLYWNGAKVEYSAEEEKVEGYATSVDKTQDGAFVVTNTHETEKVNVEGSKTWQDNNDQDGKRPESITINLLVEGEKIDSKVVTAEDDWKWSFTGLDKYAAGKEIIYAIAEEAVAGYSTAVNGYNVTNTYTPETVDVKGSKTWQDNNDQDGKRPESITINLLADGKLIDTRTVTAENGWRWEFTGLDRYSAGEEIAYAIEEIRIPGYETIINGYNVINTHTPETVTVSGAKTWNDNDDQDGIRPKNIIIRVMNGESVVASATVTAENGWKWSFTDLPKYADGEEIKYTIVEDAVEGYTSKVEGYDVTNTHTIATVSVEGSKTWIDNDDQDGKRPESITIRLLANGKEIDQATVTEQNGWKWSFTDLPKYAAGSEIVYAITEDTVEYYSTNVDGYNVTNRYTPESIDVEGGKTWIDNDDQDGKRPESITIHLLANGKEIDQATVTGQNGWKWSFTGLPRYEAGKEIAYAITEDAVAEYSTEVNGYNVINTHTPETVEISGVKVWEFGKYENVAIPESVNIRLYADGVEVASTTANAESDWAWSFGEQPVYADGEKIVYAITEDEVENYSIGISGDAENGFVVTNTYTPDLGGLTISKTVKGDGADKEKAFTFTLTLTGMAGELSYTGAENGTFNASEPLTFTLAHGQSITVTGIIEGVQYEVVEAACENYTAAVVNGSGTVAEGGAIKVDFVNTYDGEDGEVTIPKTGDPGNRAAVPVLASLAVMWLGVGFYVIKRKLFA